MKSVEIVSAAFEEYSEEYTNCIDIMNLLYLLIFIDLLLKKT